MGSLKIKSLTHDHTPFSSSFLYFRLPHSPAPLSFSVPATIPRRATTITTDEAPPSSSSFGMYSSLSLSLSLILSFFVFQSLSLWLLLAFRDSFSFFFAPPTTVPTQGAYPSPSRSWFRVPSRLWVAASFHPIHKSQVAFLLACTMICDFSRCLFVLHHISDLRHFEAEDDEFKDPSIDPTTLHHNSSFFLSLDPP